MLVGEASTSQEEIAKNLGLPLRTLISASSDYRWSRVIYSLRDRPPHNLLQE
jgi:hypothetical protein